MAVKLDTSNPLANFTQETGTGQKIFPTPTVLTVQDISSGDVNNLFARDPEAAPGGELDIVVAFDISTFVLANADTGVRFVINDGAAGAAILCCINNAGVPGLGIARDTAFTDPANYPVFVPVNWQADTTVRFRRTADGGAEILEVNGVAPNPRALFTGPLPQRTREFSSVELGCGSVEAQATFDVSAFLSERPAAPVQGVLTPTVLRIRDSDSTDKLRFRADFQLAAGAPAIDPTTQAVKVTLSTAAGAFFTKTIDGFEVKGKAPNRRWLSTAAAAAAAGIDRCAIDEDPNGSGGFFIRDLSTEVVSADFTNTSLEVQIGTTVLAGTATLVEKPIKGGSKWRLMKEP